MNYNRFGIALAVASLLWFAAFITGDSVGERLNPFVAKLVMGQKDFSQFSSSSWIPKASASEMKRMSDTYMRVVRINRLVYVFLLPTIPLIVVPWAKLRWRILAGLLMPVIILCIFTIA